MIERANDLVRTLGETAGALDSTLDQLRFGVALGGAAYILAASDDWSTNEPLPDDEIRAALVLVVGELLAPSAPAPPDPRSAHPPAPPSEGEPPPMATLLYRLGRISFLHPWRVVAAWIVILGILLGGGLALGGKTQESFSIPGTESQEAIDRLAAVFPQAAGATRRS
ncbi:hypothetical protein [Clavibacter tessellarius]|uniref:hypothetical protein n=1 Tax=Clavibacter tessellarius TaxID=31965 RepID=UPI0032511AB6